MPLLNGAEVTTTYNTEFRQSQAQHSLTINGRTLPRMKHEGSTLCSCLAAHGDYHHTGCIDELCPNCGGLLDECGCLNGD